MRVSIFTPKAFSFAAPFRRTDRLCRSTDWKGWPGLKRQGGTRNGESGACNDLGSDEIARAGRVLHGHAVFDPFETEAYSLSPCVLFGRGTNTPQSTVLTVPGSALSTAAEILPT
jgi:hypothetical protein